MEWNFAEFRGLLGGDGGGEQQRGDELGCLVDLKLGGDVGRFGERNEQLNAAKLGAGGGSKACRGKGIGERAARCLVDGCKADLSRSREYHRRHRVCEAHSKTPVVLVGGNEQRFCQQCSRFHSLEEFDEVKRSCRRRLDGHNKRRRKPQLGATTLRGPFLAPQPHVFPSTALTVNWDVIRKSETCSINRTHPPLSPTSCSDFQNGGRQFPFLLDETAPAFNVQFGSTYTPFFTSISSSKSSSSNKKIISDAATQSLESECARSLLSSPTHAINDEPTHMMSFLSNQNTVSAPLVPCSQALGTASRSGSSSFSMDELNLGTVLVLGSWDSSLDCPGISSGGADFSPGGPLLQTAAPFFWQ